MTEPGPIIISDFEHGRELSTSCEHGAIVVVDSGPAWSDAQLGDFSCAMLSARARCDCFGARTWWPPAKPDHIQVTSLRLYEVNIPTPDVDTVRPAAITPWAVSKAAERAFDTRVPSPEHSLEADLRLVRFWWLQRQLGALRDD